MMVVEPSKEVSMEKEEFQKRIDDLLRRNEEFHKKMLERIDEIANQEN